MGGGSCFPKTLAASAIRQRLFASAFYTCKPAERSNIVSCPKKYTIGVHFVKALYKERRSVRAESVRARERESGEKGSPRLACAPAIGEDDLGVNTWPHFCRRLRRYAFALEEASACRSCSDDFSRHRRSAESNGLRSPLSAPRSPALPRSPLPAPHGPISPCSAFTNDHSESPDWGVPFLCSLTHNQTLTELGRAL